MQSLPGNEKLQQFKKAKEEKDDDYVSLQELFMEEICKCKDDIVILSCIKQKYASQLDEIHSSSTK